MNNFQFESGIDDCLGTFSGPIINGPAPRWQRKVSESRKRSNPPLSPCNINTTPRTPLRTPLRTPKSAKKRGRTPIKTPKKTPQKTPSKATPLVDRFIPNRSTMDCDKSYFQLVNNIDCELKDEEMSPETLERVENQRIMKDNLMADDHSEPRILHFKQPAPTAREGYQNNLRVIYCQNKGSLSKAKVNRFVPKCPDRILDAPGLRNDFYLNLLDWGSNNCVALGLEGSVYIWDASSYNTKQLLEMRDGNYVCSVSWINEGNVLAIGSSDATVQLWDVAQGKSLRSMNGHNARVGALAWNSHILTSGCYDGIIHNHDVRVPNHLVSELRGHTQGICGLVWSPDGRLLASGGNDNMVNVWSPSISTQSPIHSLTDHMGAVKAVAWCPWQPHTLATGGGSADRHIRFWNASTGVCLNRVDTKSQICSILWSKEHRELISGHGYSQFQLSIWKYPSMVRIADLTGHRSRVLSATMSPNGEYVASAGADETIRIWKCFEQDPSKKKSFASSGKSTNCNLSMINKIR